MNILLIRHGESQQIGINPHLTNNGNVQAQQLAVMLSQIPLTKAYVSDQIRAIETFEEYKKLNPNMRFVKTKKLREIYRTLVGGPQKEGTPHSREVSDKARIDSFWKEILNSADKTVAFFTHGNVIRYLLAKAMGIEPKFWTKMVINCGSISLIQKNKDSVRVKFINSISHLAQPNKVYASPMDESPMLD